MHSGFSSLRSHCGMNIEASLPEIGRIVWRDQAGVRTDLARIEAIWTELLATHGGPMLFGTFSIADAYFAPVCSRIRTYALPVSPTVQAYVDRVHALPGVQAWVQQALAEHDFVDFDEPYRAK
jgi:glutathione S-transferase